MNFYSLFYWMTVADGIKDTFQVIAIICTVATCISLVGMFVSTSFVSDGSYNSDSWRVWLKSYKTVFISTFIVAVVSTIITIFTPSKKDALIIIAGGAVGNFVTQDTSAKHIPHEIMNLLSEKIKAEIKETKLDLIPQAMKDTLQGKSKEELIKLLEEKGASK